MTASPITELSFESAYVGNVHIAGRRWRLIDGTEGWKVDIIGGRHDTSRSYWVVDDTFFRVRSELWHNGTAENRYTFGPAVQDLDEEHGRLIRQQIELWEGGGSLAVQH